MKCVLCGNSEIDIITNKLRHDIIRNVVKCTECELVSLENPSDEIINYSEVDYHAAHGPVIGKKSSPQEVFDLESSILQPRINRIKSLLNTDQTVLEIGSSTGHFLYAIKDLVSKTVGIELDPDHSKFAREQYDLEIYDMPIEKIKFIENSFDIIFMFQVFEHINNPIEILSICKKLLKPDGIIYLEIPNMEDALLSQYNLTEYRDFYYRAPHAYYYSEKTIKEICHKVGFSGETKTAQEYTLFNHINWLQNKKPQTIRTQGHIELKWKKQEDETNNILDQWFKEKNKEYKILLEKLGIGEHVCYQGKINS